MKHTFKNIFAVVLGLIVVLSLAGCSHEPEVVVKDMGEATVTQSSDTSIRVDFENDQRFFIDLIQIRYEGGDYDYQFQVHWVGQESENASIYGLNISDLQKLSDGFFLKICDTKNDLLALFPDGQNFGGYIMVKPTLRVNFNIPAEKVTALKGEIDTVFTE